MIDLHKVKEQLPHGAIEEIAKRANVSKSTVSTYLCGKGKQTIKQSRVLKAVAIYLNELKQELKEAEKEMQEVLKTN